VGGERRRGMRVYSRVNEAHMAAVGRLVSLAFGSPREGIAAWVRSAGVENVRGVFEGGEQPTACLLRIPMGQYFGGQSVPMVGIAGVAIDPAWRGQGLAQFMMGECVRELHREGVGLSALYASTQSLYRKSGYEQAGHKFWARIRLGEIDVRERGLEMRPLETSGDGGRADDEAVRAVYAAWAKETAGALDRGVYIWRRIHEHRGIRFEGWGVIGAGGGLEGYVIWGQKMLGAFEFDVHVTDLAFTTARAGRRLLAFLAGLSTTADHGVVAGGPWSPLLALLPRQTFDLEGSELWMLRITHVERALAARGYPMGVEAAVTIDVADETVPEQAGLWTLRVREGVGTVTRGGGAAEVICADVRGLAGMYTGLMSPQRAALAGLVGGSPTALARAAAVFAGPTPVMMDGF